MTNEMTMTPVQAQPSHDLRSNRDEQFGAEFFSAASEARFQPT